MAIFGDGQVWNVDDEEATILLGECVEVHGSVAADQETTRRYIEIAGPRNTWRLDQAQERR